MAPYPLRLWQGFVTLVDGVPMAQVVEASYMSLNEPMTLEDISKIWKRSWGQEVSDLGDAKHSDSSVAIRGPGVWNLRRFTPIEVALLSIPLILTDIV